MTLVNLFFKLVICGFFGVLLLLVGATWNARTYNARMNKRFLRHWPTSTVAIGGVPVPLAGCRLVRSRGVTHWEDHRGVYTFLAQHSNGDYFEAEMTLFMPGQCHPARFLRAVPPEQVTAAVYSYDLWLSQPQVKLAAL